MPTKRNNAMATKLQVIYVPDSATLGMSYLVRNVHRDLTPCKTYSARRPEFGERDPHGLYVAYGDELWIDADDRGEVVVTRLGYGFQPVQ
ncbi:hypothetical protein fHeKpn01_gp05 [Klebsiella phage vB_KpnP_fHeKpn01]|uniref:Uncharacterized protein n=1 Tax=Klebsiella phage vB_KpnP_fHeKpn01 TaxID=2650665 RepID=A0A5J6T847_9CAUD|nr:hypothetical protein fHeKpn01_gp05 [Klebsiella phage vB_KpnP_fHeKpn01]